MNSNNPFPGLRPFNDNESHLFFGREVYINEIINKLNTHRFVSVVGNSGSGKSSLIKAGVLPKIKKIEDNNWLISVVRPGNAPLLELHKQLIKLIPLDKTSDLDFVSNEIFDTIKNNKLGLVQLLRNVIKPPTKLLLVIDQFEELFRFVGSYQDTETEQQANHFCDLLISAINQVDVPIYVLITLRSDFIGDCDRFTGLPEAINNGQFLIPRMKPEELKLSITGPIELVDKKTAPRLVQRLLKDVGNNLDQLPVMQHALMRTFNVFINENDLKAPIDIVHYEKTGCMVKALSNHAEEAYNELKTDSKKKLAEEIFKTITTKGDDNRGVRRPTKISQLMKICEASEEEIIEVANTFRKDDRGFLMPPFNVELNENSILDISHESLMRVWERLSNWVDEEAEASELYVRISESALLYEKNMAGLWRDPDLQIAVDWKNKLNPNIDWANQYNPNFNISARFIEASLNEKKIFLEDRKRNKIIFRTIVTLALVGLSVLTIWALTEQKKSVNNEQLALKEKQKAVDQTIKAEENFKIAESEKLKAELQKNEAEKQKKIALIKEQEAKLEKLKAEKATISANEARKRAELDKKIAILQKQISDSLKVVSENAEKNAYRLRILSIAQNLAIKSSLIPKSEVNNELKALLAMQAYYFNKKFKGKTYDIEINKALFNATRELQNQDNNMNTAHNSAVRSLTYDPLCNNIASNSSDGQILVFNSTDISKLNTTFNKQNNILKCLTYSTKKVNELFCSNDLKQLLLFNTDNATQNPQIIYQASSDINDIVYNDEKLYFIDNSLKLQCFDIVTKKVTNSITLESKPICLNFSTKLNQLFVGCENGNALVYSASDLKQLLNLKTNEVRLTSIHFNEKTNYLACANSLGQIILLDLKNKDNKSTIINAHLASITKILINNDGTKLTTSSLDGTIHIRDLTFIDEPPLIINEHDSWVYDISFHNNSNQLISAGRDKSIRQFIVKEDAMINLLKEKVKRNLTIQEWNKYIGTDIKYNTF